MVFAYYHNDGLSVVHINLECLFRIRAGAHAYVSNPIVTDIARIEAPQISRSEDRMVLEALGIDIDRHALSCTGSVGKRVSVIAERSRIAKDRARRSCRTSLRNTAVEEPISLRRIANVDASVNYDRSA